MSSQHPQNTIVKQSSLQVFVELLRFFYRDPLRPPTWRIALNSILLFGSFTLSIAVLFGLPLALIAIIQASESANKMFHPLRRFGISDVGVTPEMIVLGYLLVYLMSVVLAYVSRRMIASDYSNYISRITDSIVKDFDIGIRHNLFIPNLFLDRSFFNRISLTGGRTLPRTYLVLMSGLMPLVFGILSLAAFLIVDVILGVIVLSIVAGTFPILLYVANNSMLLNRTHTEDNKAFTSTFRDYSDATVFLPEIERPSRANNNSNNSSVEEAISKFKRKRHDFFRSFELKQLVQDKIRIVVGISTLLILTACFCYYLYVPFAEVRIGALFVLVLSFRYFITAVSGLSSSFISLIASHQELVEIIAFREGFRKASKTSELTFTSISTIDAKSGDQIEMDLTDQGVIELVTNKPINVPNVIEAVSRFFSVHSPRFFSSVVMVGLPQNIYRRREDLENWLSQHSEEAAHLLGLPQRVSFSPVADKTEVRDLKAEVEQHYFSGRGLILPDDLWAMLSEWVFVNLTHQDQKKISIIILNGEQAVRLPQVLRRMIFDEAGPSHVMFFYRGSPQIFISATDDTIFGFSKSQTIAIPKEDSTDFQNIMDKFTDK